MTKSNTIYQQRINKVIDYIAENLDKPFALEELATIAHFSPFYFHRIFVAIIGESVNNYTNRIRIEKAAKLLKFSTKNISTIAFECGYSSPSTFTRSFNKHFGSAPGKFRKSGEIKNSKICKELHPMENYFYNMSLDEKKSKFPITVKRLPKRQVAYIRVIDSYKEGVVIKAFEKLISWAKDQKLFTKSQFFGMSMDDPMVTPKEKYRYEACMLIPENIKPNNLSNIQIMQLPNCQYATTKVSGDIRLVATAIGYMYNDWLINSIYEPDHQYGLEYFLDRLKICEWSHFELELYIPIKPLKKY